MGSTTRWYMTPPAAIEAQRRGCHLVIDLADYGLNYSLGGIAASRSYVEEHPDHAQAFIAAYIEGLHRYRTDREFTVSVLQEFSGRTTAQLLEAHYDLTMPGMPKAPYPRTDGLAKALRVMASDLPGRGQRRSLRTSSMIVLFASWTRAASSQGSTRFD